MIGMHGFNAGAAALFRMHDLKIREVDGIDAMPGRFPVVAAAEPRT
jgi:hypothetical protein